LNSSLTYRTYSKINFYLDVLRKRSDGFHDVETLFQTVSLFDTLTVSSAPSGIALTCNMPDLSVGDDNLVTRAARLLQEKTECADGAVIHLEKRIPVAAGLAGGSGNAAAALCALNELWSIGVEESELRAWGLELGSDVPYCLVGGTVAATGRGEVLTSQKELPATWLVLAHAPVAVSTAMIFSHPELKKSEAKAGPSGLSPAFTTAMEQAGSGSLKQALFNAMEPAAIASFPVIQEYKDRLADAGCAGVLMSGSGPTVYGLCEGEAHARRVSEACGDIRTTVVHTVPHGVEPV
jgi:4-diphosphocytidyl-2-C-methyl-D-erythritol kinase